MSMIHRPPPPLPSCPPAPPAWEASCSTAFPVSGTTGVVCTASWTLGEAPQCQSSGIQESAHMGRCKRENAQIHKGRWFSAERSTDPSLSCAVLHPPPGSPHLLMDGAWILTATAWPVFKVDIIRIAGNRSLSCLSWSSSCSKCLLNPVHGAQVHRDRQCNWTVSVQG